MEVTFNHIIKFCMLSNNDRSKWLGETVKQGDKKLGLLPESRLVPLLPPLQATLFKEDASKATILLSAANSPFTTSSFEQHCVGLLD